MTIETQTFRGAVHRVTFRYEPAQTAGRPLVVCFADLGGDSELAHVGELAPLDLNRLYVLDDFGPYTDDHGYAGCWYLGEARSFTFAEDVARLVRDVQRDGAVGNADTIAVGRGKGGYAALWHAVRRGWGTALVGTPHVRLGRVLGANGLKDAARFIAGGVEPADLRWLDGLLSAEIARAEQLPAVWLHASVRESAYAQHVLPLLQLLDSRGARYELQTADHGDAVQAASAFAAELFERLGAYAQTALRPLALPSAQIAATCRWARKTQPLISRTADGLRCSVKTPGPEAYYAGVNVPLGPFDTLALSLTFRNVVGLDTVFVEAIDGAGKRVRRWRWNIERSGAPAAGRQTYLLRLDAASGPFELLEHGDPAAIIAVDVFAKAIAGAPMEFTLHEVAVLPWGSQTAPARAGLQLRADTTVGARPGQLLRDDEIAEQVRELVRAGRFPLAPQREAAPLVRPEVKVAGVLDEFSELGYGSEFALVSVTPEDYDEVLDRERPDMVLVESAWRGKGDTWSKLVSDSTGAGPSDALRGLVAAARRRDIPTVFWNKEDPPNFDVFIESAALFDHVFTTDEDCVPLYRERVDHDRISALPFAAQPRLHNPVGAPARRPLEVAFLGTFYGRKHPDRKRQMEMILDPAREFGVHIYSRVENVKGYEFPLKYQSHLIGTLPYERVLGAYQNYKALLNVNSVIGSRTMCARRIFEIAACGGLVVSGPSPAIESILGPGVVYECETYGQTRETLATVLASDELRDRRALQGLRSVLSSHTYTDRVNQMLDAVGITPTTVDRSVSLLTTVDSVEQAERVVSVAVAQRHPVQLVLVSAVADELDSGAIDTSVRDAGGLGATVVGVEHVDGSAFAAGLAHASGAYVWFASPAAVYGPDFAGDLVRCFSYTIAAAVGKTSHYLLDGTTAAVADPGREHRYAEHVVPETLVVRRELLDRLDVGHGDWWELVERLPSAVVASGERLYAADRFNFAQRATRGTTRHDLRVDVYGPGSRHTEA